MTAPGRRDKTGRRDKAERRDQAEVSRDKAAIWSRSDNALGRLVVPQIATNCWRARLR